MHVCDESYSVDLRFLAQDPLDKARRLTANNVNGFKFRMLAYDHGLKTQNSEVFGTFGTRSYVSSSNRQMHFSDIPYYGKLEDIIELNYHVGL